MNFAVPFNLFKFLVFFTHRTGLWDPSRSADSRKSFMLCEHVLLGLDYGYVHFTLFCECAVIENNLIDDFSAKTISCDLYHMTFS